MSGYGAEHCVAAAQRNKSSFRNEILSEEPSRNTAPFSDDLIVYKRKKFKHTEVVPRGRRLGPRYVVELPLLSRNLLHRENKTVTIKWVYLFTRNKQMAPKPQRDVGH